MEERVKKKIQKKKEVSKEEVVTSSCASWPQ